MTINSLTADLLSREQVNQVTSYLDASMLYGSDENVAKILRSHIGKVIDVKAVSEVKATCRCHRMTP